MAFGPKDAEVLTKEIDKLFLDENIESKVRKGGNLNEIFLQLNDWFESSAKRYILFANICRETGFIVCFSTGRRI
jgi:hypothetical protein